MAITVKLSPNRFVGRRNRFNRSQAVRVIFCHATRGGRDDGKDFSRTMNYFAQAAAGASTHEVIGHEGEVGICVMEQDGAWHAGDGLGGMNLAGYAYEVAQELTTTPFTEIQIAKLIERVTARCRQWNIPARLLEAGEDWATAKGITTHEIYDHDASRNARVYGKSDTGDLFPLEAFVDAVNMNLRGGGVDPVGVITAVDEKLRADVVIAIKCVDRVSGEIGALKKKFATHHHKPGGPIS